MSRAISYSRNRAAIRIIILDTSTLVTLCKLGMVNLVHKLTEKGYTIVIPRSVYKEIQHPNFECNPNEYVAYIVDAQLEYLEVVEQSAVGLGEGEKHAIAIALYYSRRGRTRICLVLDDKREDKGSEAAP